MTSGGFFTPRSVAVLGATDRSEWSGNLATNLLVHSPGVRTYFVNPHRPTVHGRPAHASLADVPEVVDLAYVMVGRARVGDVLEEAAKHGVRRAIVLTSGFGEAGEGGLSEEIFARMARDHGMDILGPNASGFINAADGVVAYSMSLSGPPQAGPASFVMHSGGLINPVMAAAEAWGLGYGVVASTGNEAGLDAAQVIASLVRHDPTGAIGVFLEAVRDPERFCRAAQSALDAGKPIVALTVGASEAARRAALAHTGALTPDARVTAAVLRQLGIRQVDSLEELVVTTSLLAQPRRRTFGPRLAVVSASGGACDIIADTAHRLGITLADLGEGTRRGLSEVMPDVGVAQNPLDLTGFVADEADLPMRALDIVASDPEVDVVVFQAFAQPSDSDPDPEAAMGAFRGMVERTRSSATQCVVMDATAAPLTPRARLVLREAGSIVLPGIELGLRAVGHAIAYDGGLGAARSWTGPAGRAEPGPTALWNESDSLSWLEQHGVPVIPHVLATSAEEAERVARDVAGPVAVKVASAAIPHKSRIGGVRLDVEVLHVREAYAAVVGAAEAAGHGAAVDGVVVSPMQPPGCEMFVGVRRDPTWGWVMAVGLGGVHVEVLQDVAIRALPVSRETIASMLAELRGEALLGRVGAIGSVDRELLVDAIHAIGAAVVTSGEGIEWLEVNPLVASGSDCRAVDALVSGSVPLAGSAPGGPQ